MTKKYKLPHALFNCPIRFNPFQYDAYKLWQDNCKQIYIADEVGLGKTIEVGIIIKEELEKSKDIKFLIVAPRFLCEQWKEQLKSLFYIDSKILNKGLDKEEKLLYQVYILPLSQLSQSQNFQSNDKFNTIIIDEVHYFRNGNNSKRYKDIKNIIYNIDNQILLSATPVNNYWTDWEKQIELFKPDTEYKTIRNKKAEAFPYCKIREIETVYCELTDKEEEFYKTIDGIGDTEFGKTIFRHIGASSLYALKECYKNNGFDELEWDDIQIDFEEIEEENENGLAGIQIDSKKIVEKFPSDPDTKAEELSKKLEGIFDIPENNKIVIFAHYLKTCEYLKEFLKEKLKDKECEIYSIMGKMSLKKQNEIVENFKKNRAKQSILICSDVCKEGVNLQCANTLINYDLPFNPAILEQRIGRIDRVGQVKDITIYNFIVEKTYDITVYYQFILGKLGIVRRLAEKDIINDMNITDENNFKDAVKKALNYSEEGKVREFLEKYITFYNAEEEKKDIEEEVKTKELDVLIDDAVSVWKKSLAIRNAEAFNNKLEEFYRDFKLENGICGFIKDKLGDESNQNNNYNYKGIKIEDIKVRGKWKKEAKKRIMIKPFIKIDEHNPYKILEDSHDIISVDKLDIKNSIDISYEYLDPKINIEEKKNIIPWDKYLEEFVPLDILIDVKK